MGLAPYGKHNLNIPKLFNNGRGNKNIFIPQLSRRSFYK
jgi:hypothetical protein